MVRNTLSFWFQGLSNFARTLSPNQNIARGREYGVGTEKASTGGLFLYEISEA